MYATAFILFFAVPLVIVAVVYGASTLIRKVRDNHMAEAAGLDEIDDEIGDDWNVKKLEKVTPFEVGEFWRATLKEEESLSPMTAVDRYNEPCLSATEKALSWNRAVVRLKSWIVGKAVFRTDGQAVDSLAHYQLRVVPPEPVRLSPAEEQALEQAAEKKRAEEENGGFTNASFAKYMDQFMDRAVEGTVGRATAQISREVEARIHKTFMSKIEERVKDMLREAMIPLLKDHAETIRKADAQDQASGYLQMKEAAGPTISRWEEPSLAGLAKSYSQLDRGDLKAHFEAISLAMDDEDFYKKVVDEENKKAQLQFEKDRAERLARYNKMPTGQIFEEDGQHYKMVESPRYNNKRVRINVTRQVADRAMKPAPTDAQYETLSAVKAVDEVRAMSETAGAIVQEMQDAYQRTQRGG